MVVIIGGKADNERRAAREAASEFAVAEEGVDGVNAVFNNKHIALRDGVSADLTVRGANEGVCAVVGNTAAGLYFACKEIVERSVFAVFVVEHINAFFFGVEGDCGGGEFGIENNPARLADEGRREDIYASAGDGGVVDTNEERFGGIL